MSTPARRRWVAVVWRIVCGLTRLAARDGIMILILHTYRSTSAWIPKRVMGRAQRFKKTRSDDGRLVFFSSRRRHTRYWRDWSSDVCSSDLFPGQIGLWQKPTVINNVETFINVPQILARGIDWFVTQGAGGSRGLKFVGVSGQIGRASCRERG